MSERPKLTFYSKPGCHLCDEAMDEIREAAKKIPFDIEVVNILSDVGPYEKYKHAIPVLCLGDRELFRHHISSEALIRILQSSPASR